MCFIVRSSVMLDVFWGHALHSEGSGLQGCGRGGGCLFFEATKDSGLMLGYCWFSVPLELPKPKTLDHEIPRP